MKKPPEMSRDQFRKALHRNGFSQTLLWISDRTGQVEGISWGVVMHRSGKIARRATLAKVLRERNAEIEKRSASNAQAKISTAAEV